MFFRSVFDLFFWKNIYREFSPFRMEKSPFWMKIYPFIFFSEVVWTSKKNLYREFLHSIFFRSVLNFFFEKQTPQIIFSIQNGEISILNGDFSIRFFFRRVLNFKKKYLQRIFSISERRFLHSNVFQKRFCFFFEKTSTGNFLHSEWRNLHSEWRFLHSFFSEVFWF